MRRSVLRTRRAGIGLALSVACFANGCGRSERTLHPGGEGDSLGGTSSEGGSAGRATGGGGAAGSPATGGGGTAGSPATGGAGTVCDFPYCENGRISLGSCSSSSFTVCDPIFDGIQCVAAGVSCPTYGTAGRGGAAGVGGSGCGGDCFCSHCVNGAIQLYGACPAVRFTSCNPSTSGVQCVLSGACPGVGDGGQGGGSGEGPGGEGGGS